MLVTIDKYNIVFHNEALAILSMYTQNERHQPEAGGIIIGKVFDTKINITKLSIPTVLDKASRTNFERSSISGQIVINYEFYNSNKQNIYLGEWHTHPEDSPKPSRQDMDMIKKQFNENIIETDFLILLIKGLKKLFIGVLNEVEFLTVSIPV